MAKILFWFPHAFHAPKMGSQRRALELLKALLATGHEIYIASADYPKGTGMNWTAEGRQLMQSMGVAGIHVHHSTIDNLIGWALRQFDEKTGTVRPLSSWAHTPPRLRQWFSSLVRELSPDVLFMNYSTSDLLVEAAGFDHSHCLLETHDFVLLNKRMRRALKPKLPSVNIHPSNVVDEILDLNWYHANNFHRDEEEARICARYVCALSISKRETEWIRSAGGHAEYLPMSLPISKSNNSWDDSALFAAGLNNFNVQGYLWFTAKVLPLLQQAEPDFQLTVCGDLSKQIAPLECVKSLGVVPDLSKVYAHARMAICPVFGGTGQQVKIAEAMAHGVPVVALEEPAYESPLIHGENGFICRDAQSFAEACLQLWRDPSLRARLGAKAKQTMEQQFSVTAYQEKISTILADLLTKLPASKPNIPQQRIGSEPPSSLGIAKRHIQTNSRSGRIPLHFDIAVLGTSQVYLSTRSGVFRYVRELLSQLCTFPEIDLQMVSFGRGGWNDILSFQAFLQERGSLPGATYSQWDSVLPGAMSISKMVGKAILSCNRRILPEALSVGLLQVGGSLLTRQPPQVFNGIYHSPGHALPSLSASVQRVLTIHDMIPVLHPEWCQNPQIFRTVLKSIDRKRDHIVCVSESTRRDFLAQVPMDPERVHVTHLAPALHFRPTKVDEARAASILSRLGIHAPFLLSVATLEPRKNLDGLLRAFAEIAQMPEHRDLQLVLTGAWGWKNEALRRQLFLLGKHSDRVILTGFLDDEALPILYSACEVFAYPSHYEGFGLPPLEAMACGAPVVCLNNSSLPEVVGDSAALVEGASTAALVQGILQALECPRDELGYAPSRRQAAHFTWEKTATETLKVYQDILDQAKRT